MLTRKKLGRFLRTPKGLLIILLFPLLFLSAFQQSIRPVAATVSSAVVAASLADILLFAFLKRSWQFPSGAILTGLFVAMVLDARAVWYIPACTSTIAILSKYVFRYKSANIFNPAAFGLVTAFHLFGTAQNWWGAVPAWRPLGWAVLLGTGLFIANRVNKVPFVLAFMGGYLFLFTIAAFCGDALKVAEVFRPPDINAAFFFSFFILTDPPTSPTTYVDQLLCGVVVALASYAAFELLGVAYYLLAGVLVGNVWEAWRRWYSVSGRVPLSTPEAGRLS